MKTSKKIIALILILLILASFSVLFVFAVTPEATVSLSANKESIKAGETLSIVVNINNQTVAAIESGTIIINYDSNAFDFQKSADYTSNTKDMVKIENVSVAPNKEKNYTLTFTANEVFDDFNFTISPFKLFDEGGSEIKNNNKNDTDNPLVIAIKSSDAYLKSIDITEAALDKPFSKSVYNYSLSVKNSITRINVFATANDKNAKVVVTGDSGLKVGENEVVIVVTAQDGVTKKKYTITVTRAGSSSSSSASSQAKTSVSIAQYSRSESVSSQVSSTVAVKSKNEEDTPIGLLLIVAILCAGFGGLGGYIIREQLYIRKK